jgi:hypothetical protein
MPTEIQTAETKATVVIIDDYQNNHELTSQILPAGFKVFTAKCASAGLLVAAHAGTGAARL